MIYIDLFIGFLKVGLFSFGGGYVSIALIREIVLSYGWLDDEMLSYMIAVSESTPGPIMVNLATYIGSSQGGILGAFIASIAVEQFYSSRTDSYGVDIITDKPEEIVKFAIDELDRSATIFNVTGAYSGDEKKMVRILFSKREYSKIRSGIASIDSKAFCSFFRTLFVGGEGFDYLQAQNESSIKLIKKYNKSKKDKNGK